MTPATATSEPVPTSGGPTSGGQTQSTGSVSLAWSMLGLAWMALVAYVLGRWIADSQAFSPLPIAGPDEISPYKVAALRLIEFISVVLIIWTFYRYLYQPWRAAGRLTLSGMLVVGGLLAYPIDTMINYSEYAFAWSHHAINLGAWAEYVPGHNGPTRFAEGLFWAPSQYLYLGIGLGSLQLAGIRWLRRRNPSWSFARAMVPTFAVLCLIDIVVEWSFIWLEIYSYPRSWEMLTLNAGSQYQFPLFEMVFVATYASFYTLVLNSEAVNGAGRSFIERGAARLPAGLQQPARLFAAIGYAPTAAFVGFFGPWMVVAETADVVAPVPSYLGFG